MAPSKSAMIDRAPMQTPPSAAAVGMYLLSSLWIMFSLNPLIVMSWSLSCLATSLADDPERSIQVFENQAHDERMNTM